MTIYLAYLFDTTKKLAGLQIDSITISKEIDKNNNASHVCIIGTTDAWIFNNVDKLLTFAS